MLTIGQLASITGVTARAIRHYHSCGLLPEPTRDELGYRRYDVRAIVDLVRIKTLSQAGVPLGQVDRLLVAELDEFARILSQVDRELVAQIRELEQRRHRIATLLTGDRSLLPPAVADYLDQLHAAGVSDRMVGIERDVCVVLMTRFPDQMQQWHTYKRRVLDDPDFLRLYFAVDESYDWRPDDPRLREIAEACVEYAERDTPAYEAESDPSDPVTACLLTAHIENTSPAWKKLNRLCARSMK